MKAETRISATWGGGWWVEAVFTYIPDKPWLFVFQIDGGARDILVGPSI